MKTRNKFLLSSIALAVLTLSNEAAARQAATSAQAASADGAAVDPKTVRVEVTGSSIRRLDAEQALPVTVIKASEFTDAGFTTITDVLNSISTAQNVIPGEGNTQGTAVSLRGVGVQRTLTLLNGQRLPYEPTQSAFVNLDLIPMNAIDRVEILRDGASSIYGSDAVGGVVNFITKKSFEGISLKASDTMAQQSGGGNEARAGLVAGKGNLERDGWSWYSTVDARKTTPLPKSARPDLSTPDKLSALGLFPTAVAGTTATPANILTTAKGGAAIANPYFATGCQPPNSTPSQMAGSPTCVADNTQYGLYQTGSGHLSSYNKGQLKLGADNTLSMEFTYATEYIDTTKNSAPTTSTGGKTALVIASTSPFYPGGAGSGGVPGTPLVAGVTGQPLSIAWEANAAGGETLRYTQTVGRLLLSDAGTYGDWDYKINLAAGNAKELATFRTGYVTSAGLAAGVTNGVLNPFGAQTAAGLAYLSSISANGGTNLYGTSTYDALNATANRDLMPLPGGALAVAIGADYHYERFRINVPNETSNNFIINARGPLEESQSRRVTAMFVEIDAPVTKTLDLDFAVRTDRYNDVGKTVNPKLSFRYQPVKRVMFRGSFNTGFHAPTLLDKYSSAGVTTIGTTNSSYDDPLLCAAKPGVSSTGVPYGLNNGKSSVSTGGGAPLPVGTPIPGYGNVNGQGAYPACNSPQGQANGGNPNLGPERSQDITFGIVIEPTKNITASVDYWRLHIKHTIGSVAVATIFGNPTTYASEFVRDANGNLLYVNNGTQNLGDTITSGEDVSVNYMIPTDQWGKFTATLDGTYTNQYEFQNGDGGPWIQNVGQFGGLTNGVISSNVLMTFRWKHSLRLKWEQGNWRAQVSQQYASGYHDKNPLSLTAPQYNRDIKPSSLITLTGSYTGIKNLTLTAGVKNLFNTAPTATNSLASGFLSTYSSPIGRQFQLAAAYKY